MIYAIHIWVTLSKQTSKQDNQIFYDKGENGEGRGKWGEIH